MSRQPKPRITPEEYLVRERRADAKSEYFEGEMFAMSGASPAHVLVVTNVVRELSGQLRKRDCTVYSTDLRVKVSATGLYTYPDVVVVCGVPQFEDPQADTLLNPKVIVEVLSRTTQDYDRGAKFEQYRSIESFIEYVLIAQDKPHVEHFARQADGRWILSETNHLGDCIDLESIGARLTLADVYEKVELPGA
jgi:Uma2 family endonuclease